MKNVFFNAYIIVEDNKILYKTFLILFYIPKRVLFPKKALPSSRV